MSPFSIFTLLYMTAFLLEMQEKWKAPGFALAFLALITVFVFTRITRSKFFAFLVLSTAYFLIFRFPDVANHVNFLIYLNLALMVGMAYAWIKRASADRYYTMMRPVLRASLLGIYFWAGFHKLNTDFLNPQVSCSSMMLYRILDMVQSNLLGIPVMVIVIALALFGLWQGLIRPKFKSSKLPKLLLLALLTCGGVLVYYFGFAYQDYVLLPDLILQANIYFVLAWELLGSLLLFVPRLQAPVLLLSWLMHAFIAMIGFVDFSALAGSLLFTFIPDRYLQLWQEQAEISLGGRQIHRAHLYFGLNAMAGLFSALYYLAYLEFDIKVTAGAIFNLASVIFLWPILTQLFTPKNRPDWKGLPVLNGSMPKFMAVFLIGLCCFGLMPYLGLRTAGTFSMFSNLRTEGPRSNHLLLATNPLKLWGYQEDVVWILNLPPEVVDMDPKNAELEGSALPVVEFKKMIYDWTQAGQTVPVVFEYQGQTYDSSNIVQDPEWQTPRRNWEMYLLDFRVIEPENSGPNLCRW